MSAWTAATTSGVFNGGQKHFFNYAALYAMVDTFARLQDREIADYSNLAAFDVPQKLDPSVRLQLLRDLRAVDTSMDFQCAWGLRSCSRGLIDSAGKVGRS